jgi:hypothetical protein
MPIRTPAPPSSKWVRAQGAGLESAEVDAVGDDPEFGAAVDDGADDLAAGASVEVDPDVGIGGDECGHGGSQLARGGRGVVGPCSIEEPPGEGDVDPDPLELDGHVPSDC